VSLRTGGRISSETENAWPRPTVKPGPSSLQCLGRHLRDLLCGRRSSANPARLHAVAQSLLACAFYVTARG